ncbi:MAG: undecaprenyl-diphosphate phosphatase [Weeksellaceae bacterium]|nr:undecaprenyl-diphosphate phosphatase [Weeksellaceae bacterium]
MDLLHTIILAIIEGLTEFLPISSTAHMKIVDFLSNAEQSSFRDMFEVVIQLAAILAIVVLYWKKFFNFKNIHFYLMLLVAVVPALVFGALLKKHIDAALNNMWIIAVVMILGGVVLVFIDRIFTKNPIESDDQISYAKAFKIGCFQVLSIVFPGLSRSAATIIGGLSQKLSRREAAEFSFFLAVPTMIAASAKSFYDACKDNYTVDHHIVDENAEIHLSDIFSHDNLTVFLAGNNGLYLLIGCVVSFVVAMLAVKFFIDFLNKYGFKYFGIYRIIVGCFIMFLLIKEK